MSDAGSFASAVGKMPEQCYYCKDAAVARCTKKDKPGWIVIECGELVPGDKVRRLGDKRVDRYASVLGAVPQPGGIDYRVYSLAIYGKGKPRLGSFGANSFQRIQCLRDAECSRPCCENHHTEPAESRAYCWSCSRAMSELKGKEEHGTHTQD